MNSKITAVLKFPQNLYLQFITNLPGEIGCFLRTKYWQNKLKSLGRNTKIDVGVYFQNPEFISIGENSWIDRNVVILAGIDKSSREKIVLNNPYFTEEKGVVRIGDNVHIAVGCIISGIAAGVQISNNCNIASGSKIFAFSHHYRSGSAPDDKSFVFGPMVAHDRQCLIEGPVFLGENTGVALNATILPGVSILNDSFVAINSVVMRGKYPENSLLNGNPAKVVRTRFKSDE